MTTTKTKTDLIAQLKAAANVRVLGALMAVGNMANRLKPSVSPKVWWVNCNKSYQLRSRNQSPQMVKSFSTNDT